MAVLLMHTFVIVNGALVVFKFEPSEIHGKAEFLSRC